MNKGPTDAAKLSPPLRMCSLGCKVPHYENCPDCLGWGFGPAGVIVNASTAHDHTVPRGGYVRCWTCGGSIDGLPDEPGKPFEGEDPWDACWRYFKECQARDLDE